MHNFNEKQFHPKAHTSSKKSIENKAPNLPLKELRKDWSKHWGIEPHRHIGRRMLEASLAFKGWERQTGGVPKDTQKRLDGLLTQYRNNRSGFTAAQRLKPGTRLERIYKGKKYSVSVSANGFEYGDQIWSSLSKIAGHITGTKWNGWVFFGLK